MAFVVAQRFRGVSRRHGLSTLRAGRSLKTRFRALRTLTPQERANLHASRMPIAVVTASLGGHPPNSAGDPR